MPMPAINTIILLLSGVTVTIADGGDALADETGLPVEHIVFQPEQVEEGAAT